MRMVLAMVALLLAIASPALAANKIALKGDVTYREKIALPAGGVLTVSLVDLAAPGQPRVSAKARIASPGQVPLTFTLGFEDSVILPGHQYGLIAEISGEDGAGWFRNIEPFAIDPLAPTTPILIVVNVVPAEAVEQPKDVVVVPEPTSAPPILDITWEAKTIGGNPVARAIVSSINIASDMRAGGRGGCNSWFAQAEINAERLIFSAVASTRMACASAEATAQEESFFAAIAATRFWRLDGKRLTLVDASGGELATLEKSAF